MNRRCPRYWALLPRTRTVRGPVIVLVGLLLLSAGCAKYNTFFNAQKAFDNAEHVRDEALRKHQDPPRPGGQQKTDYETAIRKAQKILDDYPGHSLTDDALFLQAKAYHRLESYRMSMRKLDLLFTNFPQTEFMEEALYLQGLNHLLVGSLARSQEFMDRLAKLFPGSRYQAETRKVVGDNAFAMKDWETAFASYQDYLAQESGQQDPDRIGLKLGECCWELRRYADAVPVLDRVIEETLSPELAFRARLLKVRMLTRLGRQDDASTLIEALRPEAAVYNSEGMLALAEAENLFAAGASDQATPLLQNMPDAWKTPEVKARAADLLGYRFLEEGQWEDAKAQFQDALRNKTVLEDYERTRRLNGNLNDFLAAEASLKDAKADRVPRLKLLQANALLFGLGRPHMAADLYLQAAADTAADSSDASRALYGAWLAYKGDLDNPDSARTVASVLQERFPASPQAFAARSDREGQNLLGYLLGLQAKAQEVNYAALDPAEREALESVTSEVTAARPSGVQAGSGARRRMVYLSRRANLIYDPPARVIPVGSHRVPAVPESPPGPGGSRDLTRRPPDESATAVADSLAVPVADPEAEAAAARKKADEEKQKKKKKRNKAWDVLR